MFENKCKYLGADSEGSKVYINTLPINRYGPYTYYHVLQNTPAHAQDIGSIVQFYEVACTLKPSYRIKVKIFDAIAYYEKKRQRLLCT